MPSISIKMCLCSYELARSKIEVKIHKSDKLEDISHYWVSFSFAFEYIHATTCSELYGVNLQNT